MKKIILIFKLLLRAKFIFKTPAQYDLVLFDKVSFKDLNNCLSKFNFFVLQSRFHDIDEVYLSYKILKQIIKNYFKGNLFTVYLISLIELIKPKAVITNIDNSLKFSDTAKILEKKIKFIAVQSASRCDLLQFNHLYETKKIKSNFLKKFYIPNLLCFGDYEKHLYDQLNIEVKNIYPVGNLRWANFLHHIETEDNSTIKYNCDICLISEYLGPDNIFHASAAFDESTRKKLDDPSLPDNVNMQRGLADIVKYTIKFCIKNNMKLIIPLKRDKRYSPDAYKNEIEFFEKNLEKEELDYFRKNILEKDRDDFSSYRAVLNSKIAVGTASTLLRDKLGFGGKILSCNLTKIDFYNFPISGICSINNCSYLEFEKRLLTIYSISEKDFLQKIDKKPDYVMKFNKKNSTINLIRENLRQLGINQT